MVVKSPHAILMDADTGAIMFQRAADVAVPPASMSKLMLLAVVFKALQNGEAKPTDEYLMSENSWRKGGAPSGTSAMFVPVGTREKLEELIKGIIVQSGNDAAMAVAENLGGSEPAFARAHDGRGAHARPQEVGAGQLDRPLSSRAQDDGA